LAVIAIARLTFANMAADSGVLLGITLVRSSFAIGFFSSGRGRTNVRRMAPRRDSLSIATWNLPFCNLAVSHNSSSARATLAAARTVFTPKTNDRVREVEGDDRVVLDNQHIGGEGSQ
jgi:hypothetical protein